MSDGTLLLSVTKFLLSIKHFIFILGAVQTIKAEFQDFVFFFNCMPDEFPGRFVSGRAEYAALWDLMKYLLAVSHGQALKRKRELCQP